MSEEILIAAFLRGENWRRRNDVDRFIRVPEMVEKAARDDDTPALTATLARQKEAGKWAEKYGAELGRNVVAEARIAELVKALEPFVCGEVLSGKIDEASIPDDAGGSIVVKMGDLRRARAVIGGQSNEA